MPTRQLIACLLCIGLFSSAARAQNDNKKQLADELNAIKKGLADAKQNLSKQHERLDVVRATPAGPLPSGNARLAIVYRNDMSNMFTPVKYEIAVDGSTIYTKTDPMAFGPGQKEVEIYRGTLTEGEHQVHVTITMKGSSAFAYLKDYKFVGRAGHVFSVKDDKLTQVKIISGEKTAASPRDRPIIEFRDTNWNINVPSPSDSQPN